eukprot:TRINITY_DN15470_c0_g4_i1.p1 TRINITY_DN15470_c0_g4~~TRINITY_DN15470_c0_g4_i1.p1  ORF type:complete len:132 (-),score=8.91 TRINITY_DN15470_c0_g4_i1:318-659(-)
MASSPNGEREATIGHSRDTDSRHHGITHLSVSDVENSSHTLAVERHESLSPRSDSDFESASSTSSFDDELPAEEFWLREDRDAHKNLVYEKFTFIQIASAQPKASRRSRSSPC